MKETESDIHICQDDERFLSQIKVIKRGGHFIKSDRRFMSPLVSPRSLKQEFALIEQ